MIPPLRTAARRAALVVLLATGACSSYRSAPEPPPEECGGDAGSYPPCPYGTAVGDVVADATFQGFSAYGDTTPETVTFAQFYSGGAGDADADAAARPRWLFVDASALWCAPCREEAQELPPIAARLAGQVAFLTVIFQGQVGVPATTADAQAWMKSFKLPFWTVADPNGAILAYFSASSPPYSMVVDTRTMRIKAAIVGKPADTEKFITDAIQGS